MNHSTTQSVPALMDLENPTLHQSDYRTSRTILSGISLIIVTLGLVGNSLLVFTICHNKALRTAMNIYVLNIALVDLASCLVVLPLRESAELQAMAGNEIPMALSTSALFLRTLTEVSRLLFMLSLSVERYQAIARPFAVTKDQANLRAKIVCLAMWAVALVISGISVRYFCDSLLNVDCRSFTYHSHLSSTKSSLTTNSSDSSDNTSSQNTNSSAINQTVSLNSSLTSNETKTVFTTKKGPHFHAINNNWGNQEVYVELPVTILAIVVIVWSYSLIVIVLRKHREKIQNHTKSNQVAPVPPKPTIQSQNSTDKSFSKQDKLDASLGKKDSVVTVTHQIGNLGVKNIDSTICKNNVNSEPLDFKKGEATKAASGSAIREISLDGNSQFHAAKISGAQSPDYYPAHSRLDTIIEVGEDKEFLQIPVKDKQKQSESHSSGINDEAECDKSANSQLNESGRSQIKKGIRSSHSRLDTVINVVKATAYLKVPKKFVDNGFQYNQPHSSSMRNGVGIDNSSTSQSQKSDGSSFQKDDRPSHSKLNTIIKVVKATAFLKVPSRFFDRPNSSAAENNVQLIKSAKSHCHETGKAHIHTEDRAPHSKLDASSKVAQAKDLLKVPDKSVFDKDQNCSVVKNSAQHDNSSTCHESDYSYVEVCRPTDSKADIITEVVIDEELKVSNNSVDKKLQSSGSIIKNDSEVNERLKCSDEVSPTKNHSTSAELIGKSPHSSAPSISPTQSTDSSVSISLESQTMTTSVMPDVEAIAETLNTDSNLSSTFAASSETHKTHVVNLHNSCVTASGFPPVELPSLLPQSREQCDTEVESYLKIPVPHQSNLSFSVKSDQLVNKPSDTVNRKELIHVMPVSSAVESDSLTSSQDQLLSSKFNTVSQDQSKSTSREQNDQSSYGQIGISIDNRHEPVPTNDLSAKVSMSYTLQDVQDDMSNVTDSSSEKHRHMPPRHGDTENPNCSVVKPRELILPKIILVREDGTKDMNINCDVTKSETGTTNSVNKRLSLENESVSSQSGNAGLTKPENQLIPEPMRNDLRNLSAADLKAISVVEMDGSMHVEVFKKDAHIDGAVCMMNPRNREHGRRRVELKTALKVGVLVICFVCLWLPYPIAACVLRYGYDGDDPATEHTLVIVSVLASLTLVVDPMLYGLSNKKIRDAFRASCKKIKRQLSSKFNTKNQ